MQRLKLGEFEENARQKHPGLARAFRALQLTEQQESEAWIQVVQGAPAKEAVVMAMLTWPDPGRALVIEPPSAPKRARRKGFWALFG